MPVWLLYPYPRSVFTVYNTHMQDSEFSTPMMQQYTKIKSEYPDALLFFRLGDFYELFMEDAKIGADVLDITLTARDKGSDGKIPMCGVPYHAVDSYIARLVHAGYKVAVCEQVTVPEAGSKIVEREVVRVITPSTILDEAAVPRNKPNYLMVFDPQPKGSAGVAFIDLGTSDFQVAQVRFDEKVRELEDLIAKFAPTECVLAPKSYEDVRLRSRLRQFGGLNIFPFLKWDDYAKKAEVILKKSYDVVDVEALGFKDLPQLVTVAGVGVGYIQETQKALNTHLSRPQQYDDGQYVYMDQNTIINLELFRTTREGKEEGSLFWLLNKTRTAMGGRLLRSWIVRPSRNKEEIEQRYTVVEYYRSNVGERDRLQDYLEQIVDIERTLGRLSVGAGNARDLVAIRFALESVQGILENRVELAIFDELDSLYTKDIQGVYSLIVSAIKDEPAGITREGNMIREGYNRELDELRSLSHSGKSYLDQLLAREREATGISNLKIGFNKVFGYYLEVSNSHLGKVPPEYIRKQTLVNAERFITQELKEYEAKVLSAEERIVTLEYELLQEVIAQVIQEAGQLFSISKVIARLDVLSCFAQISHEHRYVRPELSDGNNLNIEDGRHPIIEVLTEESFVPNSVMLNSEDQQIMVLTGPNMAGKSTFVRQVVLSVLMAQAGCFIPAKRASIGIVDKLFTRIGASDNLSRGLSTFMVEMVEVSNILHNATNKSVIVLDEVGRGTSTYDGVSIAWSVVEYLATNADVRPKTLFATHFHELLQLAEKYPHVKNYQVVVEMEGDELHFLHRVMPGGTDKSYGIEVAKRAGLPLEVIERAREVLDQLEKKEGISIERKSRKHKKQKIEADQIGLL